MEILLLNQVEICQMLIRQAKWKPLALPETSQMVNLKQYQIPGKQQQIMPLLRKY